MKLIVSPLVLALAFLLSVASSPTAAAASTIPSTLVASPTPDWVKSLVIYEIATKSFTSPDGPGSGTFASLQSRLPYLRDLGITGIWLTGHSLSDSKHFYNIWTQYAAIEPDQLDPSLGTQEEFRELIAAAHQQGIKVFLDVITHGVMPSSSLVKRNPHWFRGGSWGMLDYDWGGGHTDLDEWWVRTWTNYVIEYGVDGFRLDLGMNRPDLWARIRRNAYAAGHPIIIFAEGSPIVPGVSDFMQRQNVISDQVTGELLGPLVGNVPHFYSKKFSPGGYYGVTIRYADQSTADGSTVGNGGLQVKVLGYTTNRITHRPTVPSGRSEIHLTIGGVADSAIESLVVTRFDGEPRQWEYKPYGQGTLQVEGSAPNIDVYLSHIYGDSPSVQLSSHDNGWAGSNPDKNPYAARGSRALFGYSFLFTPMIPIFMSGEEFDADFHALPSLSPNLFGGGSPGKGRWLYGAQLDWSSLEQTRHRAMHADVRRMLTIRKQEQAVLGAQISSDFEPRLSKLSYESDIDVPVPYMRWNSDYAVIIAANRNEDKDARITLQVPVERFTQHANAKFRVTDLWNGQKARVQTAHQLSDMSLTIKRDKTLGGGLAILKIEAMH